MRNIIKKFQDISNRYDLWRRNSKIVLGVSGGPDSACMLDIFVKLKEKYNLQLVIAHVNYNLRGKDSKKDEEFVKNLAEKYGLKLSLLKPKVKSRNNLEERLRDIRYDFFEKIRRKNKFHSIAIGHTLDDQAETLLMRLLRGSGLAGMSAMRHKNNKVIRPLLGITKEEIYSYLEKNKLKYRTDKTNKEIPFLRNKIRHQLIPALQKYNPGISRTLYEASLSIAEDYDLLEQISRETLKRNKKLSARKILKLHPALQKRIILETINKKKKSLRDIEISHVEEILKAIKSTKNKRQTVTFKGLKMTRKGDKISLSLVK